MPEFKTFKGIRPVKEVAGLFATKSVDSYSKEELDELLKNNPDSFLHIIKPTWEESSLTTEERHEKVRENIMEYIGSKNAEEDRASYYIYFLTKPDETTVTALIGLVNLDDYANGKIKKHEETLTRRVELFSNYLEHVHFHAEPVLLTYPHNQRIDLLMDLEMKRLADISFNDKAGNLHELWQVRDRLNLRQIKQSIERYDSLYIADGHHRMESSLRYSQNMRKKNPELDEDSPCNYTLAMLVSDRELIINDFNRLLKDLNGLTEEELFEKLSENFDMAERGEDVFFPSKKHHLGVYINGKFYSLFVKREALTVEGMSELDTYLFDELILKPIFGIEDSRDNDRIAFIRGTGDKSGVERLKGFVDSGDFKVGFFFYPVASIDLEKISDMGLRMPPKSTYIEPKPLSGLTIYETIE